MRLHVGESGNPTPATLGSFTGAEAEQADLRVRVGFYFLAMWHWQPPVSELPRRRAFLPWARGPALPGKGRAAPAQRSSRACPGGREVALLHFRAGLRWVRPPGPARAAEKGCVSPGPFHCGVRGGT